MEKKIPVIIDCDPGHDDMMALVMAFGCGKLDIRAVTVVAGNRNLDFVTQNALNVLSYIGAEDLPVARGNQNHMVRPYGEVNRYLDKSGIVMKPGGAHGESGLEGFEFPKSHKKLEAMGAVELMAKVLKECGKDEKITLIPLGPLTNVALLIKIYPHLLCKIDRISMMGGTCKMVFTKPFMEFNTFMDPEATKIVFESGIPITMFGYDVTYRALYSDPEIEAIKAIGNQTSVMVSELLTAFRKFHNGNLTWLHMRDQCPIHDACAVAGVIDPQVVKSSQMMHVTIETEGRNATGATICDYENILDLPKNAEVVYELHNEKFFRMLVNAVACCK